MTLATNDLRPLTVIPYRWTIDRYHRAVEAGVFEGQPLELLEGELIEMSPEGIPHAGLSSDSADYLRALLGNQAKVREAKPITLPNHSEPEPDIAIVKPPLKRYLQHHPYPTDIFWLMEYANTSLEKDLQLKHKIYASANIPEYWVVNLKTQELLVFRDPADGDYRSQTTMTSGILCPVSFPTVQVAVTRLLQ